MVGRAACAAIVAFGIACGTTAPEDVDYPALPPRDFDASTSGKDAGILESAEMDVAHEAPHEERLVRDGGSDAPRSDGGSVDASVDAPIDAAAIDAAITCANGLMEIEPNDAVPRQLPAGKTCGSIDAKDIDRFVFRPTKATKISVTATDTAFFVVGDFAGTTQHQLAPGDSIDVGPSSGDWFVIANGPYAVSYTIRVDAP